MAPPLDPTFFNSPTWDAIKIAGGGILAAMASAFVKNFVASKDGNTSSAEKGLRDSLVDRVSQLETKMNELELRLDFVTRQRDDWRWLAMSARLIAETLALNHNEKLKEWPPDPAEPHHP